MVALKNTLFKDSTPIFVSEYPSSVIKHCHEAKQNPILDMQEEAECILQTQH